VSATGPVFGVIFGGWLVDYLGGYKGPEGVARTTKIILTLGVLALFVALPAAFVKEIGLLMPCIWLLLFFGGAIVPAAVGICLSAVPPSIRAFSSSVSMVVYNILGHSAGTLLPGVVMDIKAKASRCVIVKTEASVELEECARDILTVGMQIVLLWAFAALLTFGKAGWKAHWAWEEKAMKDAESGRMEEEQRTPMAGIGLPPRAEWNKLTEEEIARLQKEPVNRMYMIDDTDVELELKRLAKYNQATGLFNAAHTEFGEVFPKLKKAQEEGKKRLKNAVDKARRLDK